MNSFCWHDWSEWSQLVSTYSGVHQFRNCKKCNKVIRRSNSGSSNDYNLQQYNTNLNTPITLTNEVE